MPRDRRGGDPEPFGKVPPRRPGSSSSVKRISRVFGFLRWMSTFASRGGVPLPVLEVSRLPPTAAAATIPNSCSIPRW
ncbi:hypothetical protein [Methanoculleus chikugoensis]|uniref:hypothetical protein n=1 Tax=Methanoculleus chikugoensis TaxID=118126 RepID=UPI001FB1E84E|nr:hypothetical protein [Methanoculleus chikugoensis]